MAIHFSTFYVSFKEPFGIHPHAEVTHVEYIRMINIMFESAAYFHPTAVFSIVTSKETDLTSVAVAHQRVNVESRRSSIMLDRVRAQTQMVAILSPDEMIVFLDIDIIINANLEHLLEIPFDVGLTWRRATLPINGGIIFARNEKNGGALRFFEHFYDLYKRDFIEHSQWDGDQFALRDMLPDTRPWGGRMRFCECQFASVLLLHSDYYNFAPPDDLAALYDDGIIRERLIIHFKGNRKRLMPAVWDRRFPKVKRSSLEQKAGSCTDRQQIPLAAAIAADAKTWLDWGKMIVRLLVDFGGAEAQVVFAQWLRNNVHIEPYARRVMTVIDSVSHRRRGWEIALG